MSKTVSIYLLTHSIATYSPPLTRYPVTRPSYASAFQEKRKELWGNHPIILP